MDRSSVVAVAELQGEYGPYTFSEMLLQKLWLRRDFAMHAARTLDGRRLEVRHPGKWNGLGGPDFLGARLRFDGKEIEGDVEVHLHAADWVAHGHARDPAYDRVVLHVVLFAPKAPITRGGGDRIIPIVVLLPLLHHDLEEYAADEAVAMLANRPGGRIFEELGGRPAAQVEAMLRAQSEKRWRQKVKYARRRIEKLGWAEACHQSAMEILGYRFNRAPMLRVATAEPLSAWAASRVVVEDWLRDETVGWSVQGVRPANRPRGRLRQYERWTKARPDWPTELLTVGRELAARARPPLNEESVRVRRRWKFAAQRDDWAERLTADELSGPRLDTLMGDGWLPLLAAADVVSEEVGFAWWQHGLSGDLPDHLQRGLRELALEKTRGAAQGLLGWLLEAAEEG